MKKAYDGVNLMNCDRRRAHIHVEARKKADGIWEKADGKWKLASHYTFEEMRAMENAVETQDQDLYEINMVSDHATVTWREDKTLDIQFVSSRFPFVRGV